MFLTRPATHPGDECRSSRTDRGVAKTVTPAENASAESEASERTFRCSEPRLRSDLVKSTRMPAKEMAIMEREIIRVEPLSTYLERWKAPTSAVTRHGDTIYVSGFPPFDPQTGEVVEASIERQTELVLEQMKLCLETAGSSLEQVLKCTVYCTSVDKFAAVNSVYARYFPKDPPARIFVNVPAWPGPFDIEIDCIAAL
jgi:2-iminobutanoate/2-iminopropanoate deaminase